MAVFVVAHGAWSAGLGLEEDAAAAAGAGHELFTPTYTGLGERAHLAQPDDRSRHPHRTMSSACWRCEDLRDVVLIGHSYGGMVATGVADRAREPHRAARLSRRLRAPATAKACSTCSRRRRGRACASSRAPMARAGACRRTPMPPDTPEADMPGHRRRRRAAADQDLRAAARVSSPPRRRLPPQLHLLPSATPRATSSASSPSAPSAKRLALLRDRRQP